MNYLKKIGLSLMYFFSMLLILNLILTIFNYFSIFNSKVVSIFEIIIPIVSIIISGFIFGKKSSKKGWIEGIKLSIIILFIILIINLIFKNSMQFKNFIYFFILMFSCTLGSIIGINKNKK